MSFLQAILLSIIEGITEFLPVSSTGHMILASTVMGIEEDQFVKTFTVAIQFGAILSVVALYWRRFLQSFTFYLKLLAAFIPAAIIGKLLDDYIDRLLESPLTVGISLLAGGVVLLFVDRWFSRNETEGKSEPSLADGVKIGFFQCIAMIPGVSRSAATICGGLFQGLNRKAAAEFSFFLAVPTMFAAGVYKMYKLYSEGPGIQGDQWQVLAVGNLVAFIVAMLAIRTFISYLSRKGFRIFGYYRIFAGIAVIAVYYIYS